MANCQCSNIEIMQLFHELKQKFPVVPDHIVNQCIHQNAHNKELCENELKEENSKYLQHSFPQGLVDKMSSADDENVYFERGYTRRSLDSAQCPRRKSSSGSDDTVASSISTLAGSSASNASRLSKHSKKLGLGLPPKHAKRVYKLTHGKHAEASTSDDKEKRRHSSSKLLPHTDYKMDHRGNIEKYKKFDEIITKEKYKKLANELDDISDRDIQMSQSDQKKLCVAQQMLGLIDDCHDPSHPLKPLQSSNKEKVSAELKARSESKTFQNSPQKNSRYDSKVSLASPSPQVPSVNLTPIDNQISSHTQWNFQPSSKDNKKLSKENLLLDFSTSPQPSPNQLRLNVPSSSNDMTSVSVLSYSAPTTPLSSANPMFPPLAVDVSTGSHRTSLSLEPLPNYGLDDSNPSRPMTKVTLSLRPPSSESLLIPPNSSASGLTYTSYTTKDGMQAQLHISIGAPNMSSNVDNTNTNLNSYTLDALLNSSLQSLNDSLVESNLSSNAVTFPQQISLQTRNILSAQLERKAKLMNALMCEKERLNAIKKDIKSIEDKINVQSQIIVPIASARVSKLRIEIKTLQEECAKMTKAVDMSSANSGTESPDSSSGWICYMCTFRNHPMLPKCEQCDMLRVNLDNNAAGLPTLSYHSYPRNLHIEVTHDRFPTRSIVHSWVV